MEGKSVTMCWYATSESFGTLCKLSNDEDEKMRNEEEIWTQQWENEKIFWDDNVATTLGCSMGCVAVSANKVPET